MENPAAGSTHGLDVRSRRGRDTAGALKQVQHPPLGAQDCREGSPEPANDRSCRNGAPLFTVPVHDAVAGAGDRIGKAETGENSSVAIFDSAFSRNAGSNGDGS